jgi:hypothetical protein
MNTIDIGTRDRTPSITIHRGPCYIVDDGTLRRVPAGWIVINCELCEYARSLPVRSTIRAELLRERHARVAHARALAVGALALP